MANEKRDVPESQIEAGSRMNFQTREGGNVSAPVRRVSDVVEEGLWPDLPKIKCGGPEAEGELYESGNDFIVMEFVTDMESDNGIYGVARCSDPKTGEEFTTAIGAKVAYEKLANLARNGAFPVMGQIKQMQPKGKGRPYVDFV